MPLAVDYICGTAFRENLGHDLADLVSYVSEVTATLTDKRAHVRVIVANLAA